MKITHVTISAGRTFNHPYERYANFRFDITLKGEVQNEINVGPEIDELRQAAENIAEMHKRQILDECNNLQTIQNLKSQIESASLGEGREAEFEAIIADESIPEWNKNEAKYNLMQLRELPNRIAQLEAIPKPRLLPELEIHPGHPDHPATDEPHPYFP